VPILATFVAILALFAGVFLAKIEAKTPRTMAIIRGVAQGLVATLVLGHVLPESVEAIGPAAIVLAVIGAAAPLLLGDKLSSAGGVTMVVAGLSLHALLDGAVLAVAVTAGESQPITIAVIAHRLPLALVLATWLQQAWGDKGPWLGAVALSIATIAGVLLGSELDFISNLGPWLIPPVGGMLLHVLFHSRKCVASPHFQSAGLIAGLAVGLIIPHF
tara:strand:- start:753 stop:1403 length:651 start_codon:yes stop_codon:yes gene_type:complete